MGSPGIATAPRITITMAITIANTGRSMKKRAMDYSALAGPPAAGFFCHGTGLTVAPGRTVSRPSTITRSPALQTLVDDPRFAHPRAGFHRARLYLVVRCHHVDHLYALVLLHRALRHQEGAGAVLGNIAYAAELSRQQLVLRIGELRLHLQRARARVHLVQRIGDFARVREFGIIRQQQVQFGRLLRRPPLQFQIMRFTHLEPHPDRIQRHDGGERLGRVRA